MKFFLALFISCLFHFGRLAAQTDSGAAPAAAAPAVTHRATDSGQQAKDTTAPRPKRVFSKKPVVVNRDTVMVSRNPGNPGIPVSAPPSVSPGLAAIPLPDSARA